LWSVGYFEECRFSTEPKYQFFFVFFDFFVFYSAVLS
jgi:hypothetical protein